VHDHPYVADNRHNLGPVQLQRFSAGSQHLHRGLASEPHIIRDEVAELTDESHHVGHYRADHRVPTAFLDVQVQQTQTAGPRNGVDIPEHVFHRSQHQLARQ
jgi:hypothetical protein